MQFNNVKFSSGFLWNSFVEGETNETYCSQTFFAYAISQKQRENQQKKSFHMNNFVAHMPRIR